MDIATITMESPDLTHTQTDASAAPKRRNGEENDVPPPSVPRAGNAQPRRPLAALGAAGLPALFLYAERDRLESLRSDVDREEKAAQHGDPASEGGTNAQTDPTTSSTTRQAPSGPAS